MNLNLRVTHLKSSVTTKLQKKLPNVRGGGAEGGIALWEGSRFQDPAVPGSIPGIPQKISEMIFQEKIVDVAMVN